MKPFTLEVVTQEKHLLTETITSLTLDTEMGQITILADHLPLFARLMPGELIFQAHGQSQSLAVSGGFVDVSPRNIVTILADSAIRSAEINLTEAEQAIDNAKKALAEAPDEKTSLKIELELRLALAKAKIARKQQSRIH